MDGKRFPPGIVMMVAGATVLGTVLGTTLNPRVASAQLRSKPRSPAQAPIEPQQVLKSKDGKTTFDKANPEDITNENFPNLIESFDYPNADISEIVKAISKLTGKNFIIDKGVSGTISIIAPSQITVAEAYKAFLTALAMNGYTVVPSGNFLKIRAVNNATSDSIETYAGNYFPNADQLITRIVKLQYINADDVQKTLRPLVNKQGDITPYSPTNSLIITDYGSNMERLTNIINQLDVPGFEEKLAVIPIRFARAKDMADLIDQIINKGEKRNSNQFNPGIPRFRTGGGTTGSGSGAANYSLVIPDNRTNSIIVVGNEAGISRIRGLVGRLDFRLRPEDAGGVYVYYVRHGEAEKIANVLNGIATESTKAAKEQQQNAGGNAGLPPPISPTGAVAAPSQAIFGGDVKVSFDKENNSLVVTASKQDYEVVRSILAKIDIPRDQVFVKAIIMELTANDGTTWGIDYYRFADNTNGIGRAGFRSSRSDRLLSPQSDSGLILGWGSDNLVNVNISGQQLQVPNLLALVNFLRTQGAANVLSTPQITALDNEEAEIIVSENVPLNAVITNNVAGQQQQGIERRDLQLKLALTPFISPDTDSVRMKIDQKVENLTNRQIASTTLAEQALTFATRSIKTNIIVNSDDTAVLGGLMQDDDQESVTKVPVLGDIPIIGWLFKGKTAQRNKKNLIVFITPKIIRNSQDSSDIVDQKLNERIDFIQQGMKGRDPYGYELDRLPRKKVSEVEREEYIDNTPTGGVVTPELDEVPAPSADEPNKGKK
jgi:general secretion pathway protein D